MQLNNLVYCDLKRVVAIETGDREITLFLRNKDGGCESRTQAFNPFLFLSTPELLSGFDKEFELVKLKGKAPIACLANFESTTDYLDAVKLLKKTKRCSGYVIPFGFRPYSTSHDVAEDTFIS